MRLEYSIAPYVKMNLKWFKDWNIRYDTIKLLEENKDKILFDTNHNKIFLDYSSKEKEIKAKISKCDQIKHKSFAQERKQSKNTTYGNGEKYLHMMWQTRE